MDLTKIITVAGKPGLHRVVAQGRHALIVESLIDNKRIPVPLSVKVSSLEEISMFTTGDDVLLKDVLAKLHEVSKGAAAADPKSDDGTLWAALLTALPTADKDRIYASDVRKFFSWYAQLLAAGEFTKKDEAKADKAEVKEDATAPLSTAKKKSAKKSTVGSSAKAPKAAGASGPPKAAAVRRGGQRGS